LIVPLLIGVLSNALYNWLRQLHRRKKILAISYVLRRLSSAITAEGSKLVALTTPRNLLSQISSVFSRDNIVRLTTAVAALFLVVAGTVLVTPVGERNEIVFQPVNEVGLAEQTKQLLEADDNRTEKDAVAVSLFVSGNGSLYQLEDTNPSPVHWRFPADSNSVVGCANAHPNQFVSWSRGRQSVISSANREVSFSDLQCRFVENESRQLESIFCYSFNPTVDAENAVAICVYSERVDNILTARSIDVVRRQAEEFYRLAPRLRDLSERIERMPKGAGNDFLLGSLSKLGERPFESKDSILIGWQRPLTTYVTASKSLNVLAAKSHYSA
jgi:hypothetical protein